MMMNDEVIYNLHLKSSCCMYFMFPFLFLCMCVHVCARRIYAVLGFLLLNHFRVS